jgi:hypothetical protein
LGKKIQHLSGGAVTKVYAVGKKKGGCEGLLQSGAGGGRWGRVRGPSREVRICSPRGTMYKVGRMTEEGTWDVLVECETYGDADHACELWSHRYPNAWVDILDGALAPVD